MDKAELLATLELQQQAFRQDFPVTEPIRRERLRRAIAMLLRHADHFIEASNADFGNRPRELARMNEVFFALTALRHAESQLSHWMRPERRKAILPFKLFGARAEVQYQPLGSVGVVAPWNGPLTLLFMPLAPILAAGNRAFLRPSDVTPHCADAADAAVREYFDPSEVAVALGDQSTSMAFTSLPFDHLLFTGSTNVGRAVAKAAAEHLTPVTLELGGKCPVIVLPDADVKDTGRKLAIGKMLNGGQACLGPDTAWVPPELVDPLLELMSQEIQSQLPRGVQDPSTCGVINERQYARLTSLIDEAIAMGTSFRVLGNTSAPRDDARRIIQPIVLIDPPPQARASHEELFGPVMVLRRYTDLDASLKAIRQLDKPLGLYVFSRSGQSMQHVLDRSFSGGVTLNDIAMHLAMPDLPFGGVGMSGIGAYGSGRDGFRRFSHARAVYRQAGPVSLTNVLRPPYGRMYQRVFVDSLEGLRKRYADVKPRADSSA